MTRVILALVLSILTVVLVSACIATPTTTSETPTVIIPETQSKTTPNLISPPPPKPEPPPALEQTPDSPEQPESIPTPEPSPVTESTKPEVGFVAPDFEMQNPDGTSFSLSDISKPIVLNFWNTGCRPCRDEMPLLQQINDELKGEGLIILTINIGQSASLVKEFMEDNDLQLLVVLDTRGTITQNYLIRYIPTTYFIDADRIIQEKEIGSFQKKASIEKCLSKIMP